MLTLTNSVYSELEYLSEKIEKNTASVADYQRYEVLLLNAGLPREYIFSYLKKAGFDSWQAFFNARKRKDRARQENVEAAVVGGLLGLGLGLLLLDALEKR